MKSVSILSVFKSINIDNFNILYRNIKRQSYKNIIEWVIIANNNNNINQIIKNINDIKINYQSFENKNIGVLKNIANKTAKGEILIWMNINNYYFAEYVSHIVDKLLNSQYKVAGLVNSYIYNFMFDYLYKSNFNLESVENIVSGTLGYYQEYLQNHSYDEKNDFNEDKSILNNLTEKFELLSSECCMIEFIYLENENPNIRNLFILPVFIEISNMKKIEPEVLEYLISKDELDYYKTIYNKVEYPDDDNDIVYLAGGHGIQWNPKDRGLGGSEQAIVHLSTEWAKLGKKVAVYGNFAENLMYEGVVYINWLNYPFNKKIKKLIVWRNPGILLLMDLKVNAQEIVVDFHDNFSYTLERLDQEKLGKFLEKVNRFYFKSQYHKLCFEEFLINKNYGNKILVNKILPQEKYSVIINGLRIDDFQDNKILNNSQEIIRNPYRFCYCSSYDRGLETILEKIWAHIYRAEPRAELHIYYGMDYIFDENFKNKMKLLMSQPGVMDHGRQPMEMIIREKYLSTFHLYLSSSIAEIDCISIRESLVTGCIPILSNTGVFIDRDGLKYQFNPNNNEDCIKVAQDIINKMNNENLINDYRNQIKNSVTIVSWKEVAKLWIQSFIH
jgi:hypothetical protein